MSADTVPINGCNAWVLAIAKRPSSRQSTDTGGFGPMGSCRSSGQPATALQQLKPSMRQKRNGLGVCDAMGPCNPRATHTDGPLTERRLRVQARWLNRQVWTPGAWSRLGFSGSERARTSVHGSDLCLWPWIQGVIQERARCSEVRAARCGRLGFPSRSCTEVRARRRYLADTNYRERDTTLAPTRCWCLLWGFPLPQGACGV